MIIACLDLEGVLIPEIWINVAEQTGIEALRRTTELPLDVHLMITDPGRYLDAFVDAGASHVSFHLEADGDPADLAARLRARGVTAGVVVSPGSFFGPGNEQFVRFALVPDLAGCEDALERIAKL